MRRTSQSSDQRSHQVSMTPGDRAWPTLQTKDKPQHAPAVEISLESNQARSPTLRSRLRGRRASQPHHWDFLVDALEGVGGPGLLPVRDGEVRERGDVVGGVAEHGLDLGKLPAEHGCDDVELVADVLGAGWGEDRADRGGDHLRGALGDLGEDVSQEVDTPHVDG